MPPLGARECLLDCMDQRAQNQLAEENDCLLDCLLSRKMQVKRNVCSYLLQAPHKQHISMPRKLSHGPNQMNHATSPNAPLGDTFL